MHVNRFELLPSPNGNGQSTYNFPNGNFKHLTLQYFRGYPVAVRQYQTCIVNEAKALLSLPSHHCFPELIGVCCEQKPYLLITLFYGNTRKEVYMSLQGLLESDVNDLQQWATILFNVAQGLLLMHSCGFVHGDLKAENIIMRKKEKNSKLSQPVFLNLDKVRSLDKTIDRNMFNLDYQMFGLLMEIVILKLGSCIADSRQLSAFDSVVQVVKKIPDDSTDFANVVSQLQRISKV
jgi:serine/threonine protein kinase